MKSRKFEIREKLQDGCSIDEVCREYNLTFKGLVTLMHGYERRPEGVRTGEMYIMYRRERFIIHRHNVHYGSYLTLEDALKVRNYMIYNGWYKDKLDEVCGIVGVERCTK